MSVENFQNIWHIFQGNQIKLKHGKQNWTDESTDGRTDVWMKGLTDEQMNGETDRQIDGRNGSMCSYGSVIF